MNDATDAGSEDVGEVMFEEIALGLRPAELSSAQRERMRMRVLAEVHDRAPAGTSTMRTADERWIELAPGLQMLILQQSEQTRRQTVLLKMQPGGELPAHTHTQDEELIVLRGECRIGTHLLRAGDFHVATAGSRHERTTTEVGVLVMLRGEYPAPIRIA